MPKCCDEINYNLVYYNDALRLLREQMARCNYSLAFRALISVWTHYGALNPTERLSVIENHLTEIAKYEDKLARLLK